MVSLEREQSREVRGNTKRLQASLKQVLEAVHASGALEMCPFCLSVCAPNPEITVGFSYNAHSSEI